MASIQEDVQLTRNTGSARSFALAQFFQKQAMEQTLSVEREGLKQGKVHSQI
jgi:hypothetical protein